MADSKKKPRMFKREAWADRVTWMSREEAIRERQRIYGSTRIRMIPKRDPEEQADEDESAKKDE